MPPVKTSTVKPFPMQMGEQVRLSFTLAHRRVVHAPCTWADLRPDGRLFFVLHAPRAGGRFCDGTGKQVLPLHTGSVYFMPPQTFVECRHTTGTEVVALHMQLSLAHGRDLFSGQTRFLSFHDPELTGRVASALAQGDTGGEMRLWGLCLEALGRFASLAGITLDHQVALENRWGALLSLIRKQRVYGLRVGHLAHEMGLERTRLTREFAKAFGLPLKKFLDRNVLEEAQRCLMYTDENIRQISARLKFPDEFFFSAFFKRQLGRSPQAWRRFSRGNAPSAK